MVEVFKTDVFNHHDAHKLIGQIHSIFPSYKANFDLDDCDLILRVESENVVSAESIIVLLKQGGFYAEVLEDDFQPIVAVFQENK